MKRYRPSIPFVASLAIIVLVVAAVLFNIQAYRDSAFICENTGSRKGHRRWAFGPETGHWYKEAPLEEFITKNDPDALVHRWTSYARTGRNIFGLPMRHGHGHPGAVYGFDHYIQSRWIVRSSPEEVRKMYNLLVSDDEVAINKRIRDIWDEVLDYED